MVAPDEEERGHVCCPPGAPGYKVQPGHVEGAGDGGGPLLGQGEGHHHQLGVLGVRAGPHHLGHPEVELGPLGVGGQVGDEDMEKGKKTGAKIRRRKDRKIHQKTK